MGPHPQNTPTRNWVPGCSRCSPGPSGLRSAGPQGHARKALRRVGHQRKLSEAGSIDCIVCAAAAAGGWDEERVASQSGLLRVGQKSTPSFQASRRAAARMFVSRQDGPVPPSSSNLFSPAPARPGSQRSGGIARRSRSASGGAFRTPIASEPRLREVGPRVRATRPRVRGDVSPRVRVP